MLSAEQKQRLEKWAKSIMDCSERGHPYDSQAFPYNPRQGIVSTLCSNWGIIYERLPTQEEIKEYRDMMNIQITV
jgi:hypothetical protein